MGVHKDSWREIYENTDLSIYELYYYIKKEQEELMALEKSLKAQIKALMKRKRIRQINIPNTSQFLSYREVEIRRWNTKDLLIDIPEAEEYYIPEKVGKLVLRTFSNGNLRYKAKEITGSERLKQIRRTRRNSRKRREHK